MSYSATLHSWFLPLRRLFPSLHAWHYDDHAGTRQCRTCGQHEELETDVVSSNWVVLKEGDKEAHTR